MKPGANGFLRIMMLVTFLFLWCLPVGASSPSPLPRDAHKALYKAQLAFVEGRYDDTVKVLEKYLLKKPEAPPVEVFLLLGNAWYQLEDYRSAGNVYAEGLRFHPENVSLHLNFAVSSYYVEDFVDSGNSFLKAYELQKRTGEAQEPDLLYKAASAYYSGRAFTQVESTLAMLMETKETPKAEWLKLLVHTYVQMEDWEKADGSLSQFMPHVRDRADYWKLLAQIKIRRQSYEEAAAALEVAYRLDPPELTNWKDLSDLYRYLNAPLRAVESLNKAHRGAVSAEEHEKIASLLARAFRYEEAMHHIRTAVEVQPNAERHFIEGKYHYLNRDYEKAVESLQHSLELDPNQGKAYLLVGFSATELKNWELARKAFTEATAFKDYQSWAESGLMVVLDIQAAREAALQARLQAKTGPSVSPAKSGVTAATTVIQRKKTSKEEHT